MSKVYRYSRFTDLVDGDVEPAEGASVVWTGSGETGKWTVGTPSGGAPHNIQGPQHTASGLTPGHVLRATAADDFAFGALQDSDIPAGIARDSEVAAAVAAHEGAGDPHPVYTTEGEAAALAAAAVATHEGAGDPHPTYTSTAEATAIASAAVAAHEGAGDPHPTYTTAAEAAAAAAAAVATHEAAGNPHPTYTTEAEATAAANAVVATHEGAADPHAGYQKESEKGAANGYASLDSSTLVPVAQLGSGAPSGAKFLRDDRTWQVPAGGGGSDPWTKIVLAADFTTSATANTAVTGMNFTPAANKQYVVEVYLLLRTATATVGPRPGFSWPTVADGGAWLQAPNSATAYAFRAWGPRNTQNAASTGVPDTTNSWLAVGGAYIVSGATPSGAFGLTLASETAGTVVRMRAGSVLMYREIP